MTVNGAGIELLVFQLSLKANELFWFFLYTTKLLNGELSLADGSCGLSGKNTETIFLIGGVIHFKEARVCFSGRCENCFLGTTEPANGEGLLSITG